MDTGLLALRLVVGPMLFARGAQKLFGWFGGGGLNAAAWFFRSVGYRPPRLMAVIVGAAELIAGAALALGFVTPMAAALAIAAMSNAALAVRRRNDLLSAGGGYGYPLVTASVAVTLAFSGAGSASVDAALGLRESSPAWGLSGVVLGVTAGLALIRAGALTRGFHGKGSPARALHSVT